MAINPFAHCKAIRKGKEVVQPLAWLYVSYMTYCVVLLNLRHGVHSFRGRRVAQTDLQ